MVIHEVTRTRLILPEEVLVLRERLGGLTAGRDELGQELGLRMVERRERGFDYRKEGEGRRRGQEENQRPLGAAQKGRRERLTASGE